MNSLKKLISSYLQTDFEKDLFEAALINHNETSNRLRLNNLAYVIHELKRHFLERLDPDKEVMGAPLFLQYDPENPKMITLEQRIRYAIQGYLSLAHIIA